MKHLRILSVVGGVILLTTLNSFAGDIKIIANASVTNDAISKRELKSIFLGETSRLGGTHVEPVLQRRGPAHEAFLSECMRQSDAELRAYYRAQVFTGRGSMPKELSSDAEVAAYVAKTKGAIGYVSLNTSVDNVKVLAISQGGGDIVRKLLTRVEPEYPETLERLRIGGTVRLAVTISPKGTVDGVELLGGNPILAEAAIKAVKQWVYSPGSSRTVSEVSIPFTPKQ